MEMIKGSRFVIDAGKSLAIIHFELPDLIFVNKNYATAVFEAEKFCQIAEFDNYYEVLKIFKGKQGWDHYLICNLVVF